MQMKMNFGHSKWPPVAILKKKFKLHFDLKWRKMQTKINFEHPTRLAVILKKNEILCWIWNGKKCKRK
jgi:hypothetical protein